MARITRLRVAGYRSVGEAIEIAFPDDRPVVLVGENNAGKSNIVRALGLALGQFWPGNHEPEDHEFYGRDKDRPIVIEVTFDSLDLFGEKYEKVIWRYDPTVDEPPYFRGQEPITLHEGFIKNEHRDTCICVTVEADRNLNYHLGYSSKWTLLSRLMHRFHRALQSQAELRGDLEDLFAQVKDRFRQVPEFAAFSGDLDEQFRDLVAGMPHRLEIDFEAYNPTNFFHALRLQAAEGDEPRTLEEMGTGEQQVLALAFAHAYAKAFHGGIVLVVEEPEAHLHPLAQQWLAQRLKERCADGLQILITTHSPAFLDMEGLEGIVRVDKGDQGTRVRQLSRDEFVAESVRLGAPADRVTAASILPFYAANATASLMSGFFARGVVLVEGPTEALALPLLFAARGFSVEPEGIAVLSVGGKGNLAKWSRLYASFGIASYLIFDNDQDDDASGGKRRDALRSVAVPEADVDALVSEDEWRVETAYTIFGRDFETSLRSAFSPFAELERQARDSGVDSKPFVARWVAQRLDPESGDIGWGKIDAMIEAIRG
jgi:putative ATP-dependent endonuclease of OLD family